MNDINNIDFNNQEQIAHYEKMLEQILTQKEIGIDEIRFLNYYITTKEAQQHNISITVQNISLITYLNRKIWTSYKQLALDRKIYQSATAACTTPNLKKESLHHTTTFYTDNYEKKTIRLAVLEIIFTMIRGALQSEKKEIFHKKQHYCFLTESIIRGDDFDFYLENRNSFQDHKDGRLFGIEQAIALLQKNNLTLFPEETAVIERSIQIIQPEKDTEDQLLLAHKLEQIVRKNPKLLKKHPELNIEFNPNGSRKNIKQLIKEINYIDQGLLDYLIYNAIYLDPNKEQNLISLAPSERSQIQKSIDRHIRSLVANRSRINQLLEKCQSIENQPSLHQK